MRQQTILKIIALLRAHLDRGFTILEISKKLSIGYRPAHMHISELEKKKVIMTQKVGNAKQCTLNLENAQCRHFLQEGDLQRQEELYAKNTKIKNILSEMLSKMTEQIAASLHCIILFGSYAKGTATKNSDIDLLFMLSDMKDKAVRTHIERICASYHYSHNVRISPMITDQKEFLKMLKSKELSVGKEAKEHGIAIYGSEQFWRLIAWRE